MGVEHDQDLSEEQLLILDTVRKLVTDEIEPRALEFDEHARFVRPSFEQLGETGILGLPIAEAGGGAEMGWLSFAVALEAIAGACGSTARLLLSQSGLCGKALDGIAAAREHCSALAMGARLGAFVGPEHGIRARPDGDALVLSGAAPYVTAAAEADLFVVAALNAAGEPLLLCLDAADLQRAPVRALGFRASAPGEVAFADSRVPAASVVARGADAAAALARASLAACIGGGAIATGAAFAAYELARRYAHERVAFGKALIAQQAVRHKLVETLRRARAARHMVLFAARRADAGEDAAQAAMLAKLEAVEAALLASDEAIQVHGGYGYVVEYHVERLYRDANALGVLDHASEDLRDRIAARL